MPSKLCFKLPLLYGYTHQVSSHGRIDHDPKLGTIHMGGASVCLPLDEQTLVPPCVSVDRFDVRLIAANTWF